MVRSTTCGCHFINQPLSSFILRNDPQNFLRWWIQQTSSVGGRDFLPKLRGCFKFSSFKELVQKLMTCLLLFRLFDIFKGLVGLFLCGRTPCDIATPDTSIWNVSRVLTLYHNSSFLSCITVYCFPVVCTFWKFVLDNSRYFLMNHNKLDSSSAGVSMFGAGADGIVSP